MSVSRTLFDLCKNECLIADNDGLEFVDLICFSDFPLRPLLSMSSAMLIVLCVGEDVVVVAAIFAVFIWQIREHVVVVAWVCQYLHIDFKSAGCLRCVAFLNDITPCVHVELESLWICRCQRR